MTGEIRKVEQVMKKGSSKGERNFTYEPVPEYRGKSFQMDARGNFRIVVKGREGLWETYEGIANIEVDGEKYIGVSDYYKGSLPTECVLKVQKVDEYGYHGYVRLKIADIRSNFPEILNKDDIKELLTDILQPNNYIYYLKEIPGDKEGFFKVKIIDMEGKDTFDIDDLNILDITKVGHLLKKLLFEKDYEIVIKGNEY